jgi:iron complex outermembrane receptor protein
MRRASAALLAAALMAAAARADGQTTTEELKRMTLEELMSVEVTTVSRSAEAAMDVPAAVFVITREDIRRSGATTLPEVLRLAPGIQVARIDGARYAVGIRGFADRLARSMLVLIDGRAVYSPLFAGTYWEVQDTLLEDVDRIEVIRGPGGTLWGANAVNGIINIVTRPAAETQGGYVIAGGGSDPTASASARYGGRAGENGFYRAYVKAFTRGDQYRAAGTPSLDWQKGQAGGRADWALAGSRTFTVQGDLYAGSLGQQVTTALYAPPFRRTETRDAPLAGGNVLARWSGPAGGGAFQLQTYYDRTSRDERPVAESRDTFDVDFQHRRRFGTRQRVIWGTGYRVSADRIETVEPTRFDPDGRTDQLVSAFGQYELALDGEKVRIAAGSKIEHNDYSGFEAQPSARISWNLAARQTVVASITRAVRTPSQVETDYTTTSLVNPEGPSYVRLLPNPGFRPERLIAYEIGYRIRAGSSAYFTVSGFYNTHRDVVSTELQTPFVETSPGVPRLILPIRFGNGLRGTSGGVEVTGDVRPATWWHSTGNYSFLTIDMARAPGSRDVSQVARNEGLSPRHRVQLLTSLDLPRRVSFDWGFRYVSELKAGPVPAYATSNVRLAWAPRRDLEIALNGRDLHEPRHLEWPGGADGNVLVERSWFVNVTWRR